MGCVSGLGSNLVSRLPEPAGDGSPTIRSQNAGLSGGWSGFPTQPKPVSQSSETNEIAPVVGGTRLQPAYDQPLDWQSSSTPYRDTSSTRQSTSMAQEQPQNQTGHSFAAPAQKVRLGQPRIQDNSNQDSPDSSGEPHYADQAYPLFNQNTLQPESRSDSSKPVFTTPAPKSSDGLNWQQSSQNAEAVLVASEAAVPEDIGTISTESPKSSGLESLSEMDMAGPPSVTPSREPSVMDRIRDLYSPRRDEQATDESATELIRRPFRRLQSPWGLLRSREVETADLLLPPQSVESPIADSLPESSLSVGPAPDAELPAPELLDMLITDFERRTSNWPRDATGTPANPARWRRLQTDLRLLHLIADHSALANAAIDGLPGE